VWLFTGNNEKQLIHSKIVVLITQAQQITGAYVVLDTKYYPGTVQP